MIKNIIKTNKFLSVTLSDGTVLVSANATKELLNAVKEASTDEEITSLMCPDDDIPVENVVSKDVLDVYNGDVDSDYIEFRGNSAYIPSISELTVPQDFVEAIIKAEKDGDEDRLQTYLNFWTLVSLNPDSRVRNNLFWFINKWGIKILKSGLLVTYRNADFKREGKYGKYTTERVTSDWIKVKGQKKSPKKFYYSGNLDEYGMPTENSKLVKSDGIVANSVDELYEKLSDTTVSKTTFTDHHSHSFTIKIGEVVSMPREDCDNVQENSCSQGLHVGAPGWLKRAYYGDTGLVCLVNPANAVAIPMIDEYGKMRCCEYLPIAIAQYDDNGDVVEDIDESGLDIGDKYLVDYSGRVNNEDLDNYTLTFARTVGIDRDAIAARIFEMARNHNS